MESKILIEPIINGKKHGFAIQARKFSFDLKVTNKSNRCTPEILLENIYIKSAQGQDIRETFPESFYVKILNPEESCNIKIGENGQFMYGLVDIHMMIRKKDSTDTQEIKLLQSDPFTGEVRELEELKGLSWIDFFYIKSLTEYQQENSTKWIIKLTMVMIFLSILQIVFGFMKFGGK